MAKIWFFVVCVAHGLWAVVSPREYDNILKKGEEMKDPPPDHFGLPW